MEKNDITYEYRVFTNRPVDVESLEVGRCTSKVIKELKSKDKIDGRFFHTSDTDEWYFCWNGELQKLNLKGDADVNAALDKAEELIGKAQKAADDATAAANDATAAANKANAAVESIDNKADKSEVAAVSKAVEAKADKSDVDRLSKRVDDIKVPSLDGYATEKFVTGEIEKINIPPVPTKVSDLENDANYLNKEAADKLYAALGTTGSGNGVAKDYVDTELAKKQDTIADLANIRTGASLGSTAVQPSDLEGYAKASDLASFVTSSDLTDYAKVSDLSGFVTSSDLTDYAKASDLASFVTSSDLTDYAKVSDLTDYAKTSDLAGYAKVSDLTDYAKTSDLSGFVTSSDLTDYAKVSDLSSYAKASEVYTIAEIDALIGDAKSYIKDTILA